MDYALNYYFNVIPIFKLEQEKFDFGTATRVTELFKVYGDIIVGILEDSSIYDYEIDLKITETDIPLATDDWELLKRNERAFKILSKRYMEIEELGGKTDKATLRNNDYNNYVNGLKRKKLGRIEDENELDSYDRIYWKRQKLFKDIIDKHLTQGRKTTRSEYKYTTVEDILNFFSGNNESKSIVAGKGLYKKFQNEDGEFDFNLTCDSIGKYLRGLERYFRKRRIDFGNDKRLIVYALVS